MQLRPRLKSTLLLPALMAALGAGCGKAAPQPLDDAGAGADGSVAADTGTGPTFRVTTAVLPTGLVGAAYQARLTAADGVEPYHFALGVGSALPAGMTLADDGTVSGTPTQAGTLSFAVDATDSASHSATGTVRITVDPVQGLVLSITTATLPGATVGQAYSAQLAATGGSPPYRWSLAGGAVLPGGLSLDAAGAISGTPTDLGTTSFTVQVLDASAPEQMATALLSITVSMDTGPALAITTSSLARGQVGVAYSVDLMATGGLAPYAWELEAASTLPPGLNLAAGGQLSGSPTVAGRFTFTVLVRDAEVPEQSATRGFVLNVAQAAGVTLVIANSQLPVGVVGEAYQGRVRANGGTPPYAFTVAAGTLPPGLQLGMNGTVTGTPTAAGTFDFNAEVTDASAPAARAQASLRINVLGMGTMVLVISQTPLPQAVVNLPYSAQLEAVGGTPPLTWSITGGRLPQGFSLAGSGLITGTTTTAGRASFTLRVADSGNPPQTAVRRTQLTVLSMLPPLQVGSGAFPRGVVGQEYNETLGVRGGTPPYTMTMSAGALPPGLSVLGLTLTGTPTMAGTFHFDLTVTDRSMPTQTVVRTSTLTIDPTMGGSLRVTTRGLPTGTINQVYTATLAATGGTPPYTWSLPQGTLPAGITLDPQGVISGTPTAAANAAITVRVTDSAASPTQAQRQLTLRVR